MAVTPSAASPAKHPSSDRYESCAKAGLGEHDEDEEQARQAEGQTRHEPGEHADRAERLDIELNRATVRQDPHVEGCSIAAASRASGRPHATLGLTARDDAAR